LGLDKLLFEPLSFCVVEEIDLHVSEDAVRERSDEASHNINWIATALVHLEFMSLHNSVLPHHLEQFDAVSPAAKKFKEITGGGFFDRGESEYIREGRIAGHDSSVSLDAQSAREILRYEAPIVFLALAQGRSLPAAFGDVSVDL
jgi:hypothetical protein